MKQREAVYASVVKAFQKAGVEFTPGQDARTLITPAIRSEITKSVVELFESGEAEFKDNESNRTKLSSTTKLTSYVTGLITNWLNKDPNLNGGSKHQAKNPGSRAGGSDPMLKEMRLLKKQLQASGNADGLAKVEAAIQDRVNQLKLAKQKQETREIDIDSLPDFLKDLVV